MPERNEDGTFKKGISGNPGGRAKGVAALVRELSNNYQDYFIMLDKWARDETLAVKERRACVSELLNRSLGMPKQRIDQEIIMPEPIRFVPKDA